ncbi:lysoplasmalogenase [Dyella sp. LX-66]|nr:lysoplasmalogenase [Dyella sp. LX-1]MBT2140526.1 lysoplasmalogenase [Dyella sp. LX-66]
MAAISSAVPIQAVPRWMALGVLLSALGAIAGAMLADTEDGSQWMWLHWACKPLATGLVFALAWRVREPISARYRAWVLGGLGLALVGDVLLMLPQDLFVEGLVAFLFAHLCFLVALTGDARLGARPIALLICLGYAALCMWSLWPTLPVELHLPIVIYTLVLALMGGQAVGRAWYHALTRDALANPAWLAGAGSILFMLSDTLLAWNRFRISLPLAALWILGSYFGALWLLARSVMRASPEDAALA